MAKLWSRKASTAPGARTQSQLGPPPPKPKLEGRASSTVSWGTSVVEHASDEPPAVPSLSYRRQSYAQSLLRRASSVVVPAMPPAMGFLFATPLVHPQTNEEYPLLDAGGEERAIREAHFKSNSTVKIFAEHCTEAIFRRMLDSRGGVRVLHYMGHGLGEKLAFECERGMVHEFHKDELKKLFNAGRSDTGPPSDDSTKLVVVSACYSEPCGQMFVDAGVPHVVAINRWRPVLDEAGHTFANAFYFALFNAKTVKHAFESAVQVVRQEPKFAQSDEWKKFKLMGAGPVMVVNGERQELGHDVPIFNEEDCFFENDNTTIERMGWLDELLHRNETKSIFFGRQIELQHMYEALNMATDLGKSVRCVRLIGSRGSGRSALVDQLCNFLSARSTFQGIFLLTVLEPGDIHYEFGTDLDLLQAFEVVFELDVDETSEGGSFTNGSFNGGDPNIDGQAPDEDELPAVNPMMLRQATSRKISLVPHEQRNSKNSPAQLIEELAGQGGTSGRRGSLRPISFVEAHRAAGVCLSGLARRLKHKLRGRSLIIVDGVERVHPKVREMLSCFIQELLNNDNIQVLLTMTHMSELKLSSSQEKTIRLKPLSNMETVKVFRDQLYISADRGMENHLWDVLKRGMLGDCKTTADGKWPAFENEEAREGALARLADKSSPLVSILKGLPKLASELAQKLAKLHEDELGQQAEVMATVLRIAEEVATEHAGTEQRYTDAWTKADRKRQWASWRNKRKHQFSMLVFIVGMSLSLLLVSWSDQGVREQHATNFSAIDSNHDGCVGMEEVNTRYFLVNECVFGASTANQQIDSDHDGCVDISEFNKLKQRFFGSGLAKINKKGFQHWLSSSSCVPDEDVNHMAAKLLVKAPSVSGMHLWNLGSRNQLMDALVSGLPQQLRVKQAQAQAQARTLGASYFHPRVVGAAAPVHPLLVPAHPHVVAPTVTVTATFGSDGNDSPRSDSNTLSNTTTNTAAAGNASDVDEEPADDGASDPATVGARDAAAEPVGASDLVAVDASDVDTGPGDAGATELDQSGVTAANPAEPSSRAGKAGVKTRVVSQEEAEQLTGDADFPKKKRPFWRQQHSAPPTVPQTPQSQPGDKGQQQQEQEHQQTERREEAAEGEAEQQKGQHERHEQPAPPPQEHPPPNRTAADGLAAAQAALANVTVAADDRPVLPLLQRAGLAHLAPALQAALGVLTEADLGFLEPGDCALLGNHGPALAPVQCRKLLALARQTWCAAPDRGGALLSYSGPPHAGPPPPYPPAHVPSAGAGYATTPATASVTAAAAAALPVSAGHGAEVHPEAPVDLVPLDPIVTNQDLESIVFSICREMENHGCLQAPVSVAKRLSLLVALLTVSLSAALWFCI